MSSSKNSAAHNDENRSLVEAPITEIPCINGEIGLPAFVTPGEQSMSKKRVIKNLFLLGLSYFLYFTSFWSLSNLESTMNAEENMGVISQAVIYLCSMASCFFPELFIGKIGTKNTYVISLLLSVPYIAANFSLHWGTMMTTAFLYGILSGPLNAALTCYVDEMSIRYTKMTEASQENVEALFFGISMFFNELTQVSGNIIVYFTLQKGRPLPPQNFSYANECGIHFDPAELKGNNSNLDPPTTHDRYMLTGVFLLLGVLAVVITLLLDPLGNDVKEVKGCRTVFQKFISAARLLKNPHQLLLVPLTIYMGMESAFYSADFCQAYIACSWGVHHVGFVTICFGACGALMAILVGPLVKCVGQMSVIILAALINVTTCVLLFLWQPSPDVPTAYFAFAGVWGMTDAIWWSQVAALYGLMFPNDREAAFSNFFFWSFLGYFLSYAYANYIDVALKIIIMVSFLVVGMSLYIIGQVKLKCFTARSGYVQIGGPE